MNDRLRTHSTRFNIIFDLKVFHRIPGIKKGPPVRENRTCRDGKRFGTPVGFWYSHVQPNIPPPVDFRTSAP